MELIPAFFYTTIFYFLFIGAFVWFYHTKKAPFFLIIAAVLVILLGVNFLKNDFLTQTGTSITAVTLGNTTTTTETFSTAALNHGITHSTFGVMILLLGIMFLLIGVLEQLGVLKV